MTISYGYWFRTTALATMIAAASVALPQVAAAQDEEAATDGADLTEEQIAELIAAFEASPEAFLGYATEEQLAAVLTADPEKIDTVIGIVETTNPEAAGLVGRAAALAVANLEEAGDVGDASDIQTVIAASTASGVLASFTEASDEIAAAAGEDDGEDVGVPVTLLPDDEEPPIDEGGELDGTPPAPDEGEGDDGGDADDGGAGASGGVGFSTSGGVSGGGDDGDDDDADAVSPG